MHKSMRTPMLIHAYVIAHIEKCSLCYPLNVCVRIDVYFRIQLSVYLRIYTYKHLLYLFINIY